MKAVIFDFNGTLFDDHQKHQQAWNKMAELIRGSKLNDDELFKHCNGVVNQKIIEYLSDKKLSETEIDKYSKMKEAYYRMYCENDKEQLHLVKGAYAYFEFLKRKGIPFAIASASIKENIDFFKKMFFLGIYFDDDHIIYDDGNYQDKVSMFKKAAQQLNCDVKDCMIFEDSESGIKAAHKAGCENIVVVNTANHHYDQYDGVVKVIDNFKQVCE